MPKDNMNQSSSVDNDATTSSVNNNSSKKNNSGGSYSASKRNQQDGNQDSNKKAAKVAAKGAATYFAGPAGGKAVDALAKTKAGDQILNKGGELLNKIPGMSKATKKLDDSGALDAADKGLSVVGGAGGAGGASGNAAKGTGASTSVNSSSSLDKSPSQDMANSLGKGLGGTGGKKGGLGNSSQDDQDSSQQDSSRKKNGEFSEQFFGSGFGFIDKKKIILFCIISILPIIFIGLIISFIGGADDKDEQADATKTGREGYVDKEGAKGTEYEKYIKGYNESSTSSTSGANCTYNIKGITNSSNFTTTTNLSISNLKIRLMYGYGKNDNEMCDAPHGKALDEPLVDFEDYIMGVVYAEISGGQSMAEAQAQAIAARSFTLYTAIRYNKLKNENGQWIIEIRNCVADQVYCNVDAGCSKKRTNLKNNQDGTLYSGVNNINVYKGPLAKNAKQRAWISQVNGVLAYNKNGYVLGMNYAQSEQDIFRKLGNDGLDYKQVLKKTYGGIYEFNSNCSGSNASTGDYSSWKQYGEPWSNIHLGSSSNTIQSAGCLATSLAMLVAKSGVSTNVSGELNPGTFVQALSKNGGFSKSGNLQWNAIGKVAPNFVWQGNESVLGKSKKQKLNKITSLINSGYYVVAEVKGNTGQHWVAIDSINGETITMMDPGSTYTNMWQQYDWKNTSRLVWFKAG